MKKKIACYKISIVVLFIALSGISCAIPLQVTIKKDPIDVFEENRRIAEEKSTKEQVAEVRERDIILKSFQDSAIILKAFEKLGCSIFDIATFLNEYGKTDIDGFCDFLAEKYPLTKWFRWALDRDIFIPAKRNYELLKKINEK